MKVSRRNPLRSLLAVPLFLAVVCFIMSQAGCVTVNPIKQQAQEVVVKVRSLDGTKVETDKATEEKPPEIRKSMMIPYTEPQFPDGSYVIGDTCYMNLWAYVSASDALNLFKTVKVMQHKDVKKLYIILNSGGGSAFDGLAVADLIIRAGKEGISTTVEANGMVASAAVPIFVSGNLRVSSKGTVFMLHDIKIGKMFAYEGKDDLRSQGEMIDIEENRYCGLISERSKLSADQVKEMCRRTTWFTADKAKEYGIVDEIK